VRTAVVKFWEPAEIDVCNLERIVVLEFEGEQGAAVATALTSQLGENQFYSVVDRTELSQQIQMASFSPGKQNEIGSVVDAARSSKIDGVVLGEVLAYRCEDRHERNTRLKFDRAQAADRERLFDHRPGLEVREDLVRDATVAMAFRLVEVKTGEVRASRQVSHQYEGRLENGVGKLPEPEEILAQLSQQCLSDIVDMLAPHQSSTQMELARCDVWTKGRQDVKEGILYAEKGDWDEAELRWLKAVEENPKNHAALFNLAIAADQRQCYDLALEFAMRALRLQHSDCYAKGVSLIRAHRSSHEKSQDQRDAQVVNEAETEWR
jgi:hypothetical protein